MSLPSLYEWFLQTKIKIKQNLLMMTLIITSTFKQILCGKQKHFNFYLNKLLYCLRLVVCCLYALMWLGLLGLNNIPSPAAAAPHMRLTQRNNHANISELLDNLLRGYDNSIRPGFGGEYHRVFFIGIEILRKLN